MDTLEWVVFFLGAAVVVASVIAWLAARRGASKSEESNPGLIQPDQPPGPPGSVSPGMVGALLDGAVHPRNLFLTIIDLAIRGFLQITPLTGDDPDPYDWVVRRTDKPARGLRDFEATLVDAPVNAGKPGPAATMTSLMSDVQDRLTKAMTELRAAVARAGWFSQTGTARKPHTPWAAIGGVVILLGLAGAAISLIAGFRGSPWIGLAGSAMLVLSGLLLVTLTRLRPTITPVGDQTRGQVQRYRAWLEHLQPQDIMPDTAGEMFDANLAPALAFGMQHQFAEVFDTACARHRNWGKTLVIATPWLQTRTKDLASRVKLLDQFLDDAVQLAGRVGLDDDEAE